jgi:hypothetical protein
MWSKQVGFRSNSFNYLSSKVRRKQLLKLFSLQLPCSLEQGLIKIYISWLQPNFLEYA